MRDRYPLLWPSDPRDWLMLRRLMGAWVAEDAGRVIGHVAVTKAEGSTGAEIWSGACNVPPASIASVSALFVWPGARGRGLGAALLARARQEARSSGRRVALEVLEHNRAALALYERAGWTRVGSEPAVWAEHEGRNLMIHYYIAPI